MYITQNPCPSSSAVFVTGNLAKNLNVNHQLSCPRSHWKWLGNLAHAWKVMFKFLQNLSNQQINKNGAKQTNIRTNKQNRQRQTDRQTDKQTNKQSHHNWHTDLRWHRPGRSPVLLQTAPPGPREWRSGWGPPETSARKKLASTPPGHSQGCFWWSPLSAAASTEDSYQEPPPLPDKQDTIRA